MDDIVILETNTPGLYHLCEREGRTWTHTTVHHPPAPKSITYQSSVPGAPPIVLPADDPYKVWIRCSFYAE
jgi:hypothetical protein